MENNFIFAANIAYILSVIQYYGRPGDTDNLIAVCCAVGGRLISVNATLIKAYQL